MYSNIEKNQLNFEITGKCTTTKTNKKNPIFKLEVIFSDSQIIWDLTFEKVIGGVPPFDSPQKWSLVSKSHRHPSPIDSWGDLSTAIDSIKGHFMHSSRDLAKAAAGKLSTRRFLVAGCWFLFVVCCWVVVVCCFLFLVSWLVVGCWLLFVVCWLLLVRNRLAVWIEQTLHRLFQAF